MTRKKKAKNPLGKITPGAVWIAPDLERKIKGEGGRRGMTEPPYGYYLHLADVALRSSGPAPQIQKQSAGADSIPGPEYPVTVLPKLPKLSLPKPPKSPTIPKPAKRSASKPPQRPSIKKLSLPKPPRRKR